MKPQTKISAAEWEVMAVAWKRPPIAASEVIEQLEKKRGWHTRTVRTLLDRLVKKGALRFEVEGKRYLYWPKVTFEQCVQRESRGFLDRVFGGEPGPMLAHLVRTSPLSPAEIKHLKKILNEKEK